ncbi:MAG: hypothetical protein QM640_14360 [Niabella sp.]
MLTDSLQTYLQIQDYTKAIYCLTQNNPGPGNLRHHYLLQLGYCYFMNDEEKNSKSAYLEAYQGHPNDLQANLYLGIIFQKLKNYDSALYYYKNLTVIQPDQYKYWFYASSMFNALREDDSAFLYIQKAYALRPTAPDVLLRYSAALTQHKQKDKAVTLIDDFLKTNPANEEVIARKITYSAQDAKYGEVILWGERLLKDSAEQPTAYTHLAYAYLNNNQIDKCLALYDWMDLQHMKNEMVTYCAAMCYSKKKDYSKSNLLLDECLSQNLIATAVTYFRSKADNYESAKDYKKALSLYDTAYYIFHNPLDLYYKGRVYDVYLKNQAQASVLYKKYIAAKQKPESIVEQKLFNYIKEYIKP